MAKDWIAEKVQFGWLIQNSPFYMENPLENPDALPHYTCEDIAPETEVWTLYEPWRRDNPWLKREVTRPPRGSGLQAGQLAAYMFETIGLGQTK